jgi:hypothetical protein
MRLAWHAWGLVSIFFFYPIFPAILQGFHVHFKAIIKHCSAIAALGIRIGYSRQIQKSLWDQMLEVNAANGRVAFVLYCNRLIA